MYCFFQADDYECKLKLSDSVIHRITPVCDRLDLDTTPPEESIRVRCEICYVCFTSWIFNFCELAGSLAQYPHTRIQKSGIRVNIFLYANME